MASTDVDEAALRSVMGEYRTAIQTGAYVTARRKVMEAIGIRGVLGQSGAATGTSFSLPDLYTLLEGIDKLQVADAQASGGPRFIRTGVRDGGRRRGGGGIRNGC